MRPLIVLVIVLVALGALIFGMGLFDSPKTAPAAVGPATRAQPAGERGPSNVELARPESGSGSGRGNVVAAPGGGQTRTESVTSPGQGNQLVGSARNSSGQPVVGARVRVSREPMMGDALAMMFFTNRPSGGPATETKTDAQGRYTFKDLAPAHDYYVAFEHPDYSQQQESLVFVGEVGEFRGPEVVMVPGSTLFGYVRDIGGNPVPDAVLHLDSAYNMSWDQPNPDRLETKADVTGYYEITNIPQGPRNLLVEAPGYGTQVVQNRNFKGKEDDRIELDVQLDVGHPIIGHVVGPDGVGVAGASVVAVNFQNQITSRGEATTDETGAFQIEDLRNGQYILMVSAEGYTQARRNRIQSGSVDVVVELTSQACISGRVLAAGKPVQNFTIEVRRTTPASAPGATRVYEATNIKEVVANAEDGRFELCRLDGGFFVVVVTAEGHAPGQSEVFQAQQGTTLPPITINLSTGGRITGRVVDPQGAPVAGALLSSADSTYGNTSADDFLAGLVMSLATQRDARTNAEGYFELSNLSPALYRVVVEHPGFTSETMRDLSVTEGQETSLGDITLRVGGVVRGAVIDQAGLVLSRGFVTLISTSESGLQYQTRTDSDGRFEFQHVRPASYKLSATRSSPSSSSDAFQAIIDQQASEVSISVSDGDTVNRNLNLGS